MNALVKLSILPAILLSFASAAFADGVVIYNTIPSPLPPNVPSQPYEAVQSGAFGNLIQFAGGDSTYALGSATVAMSDWALGSNYLSEFGTTIAGATITSSGFYLPLTLDIYNVGVGNTVGSLIDSDTIDAFIPWRPAPSPSCPIVDGAGAWQAPNGGCYNGALSTVTFDLTGVTVPDQVIYSVAFNTTDYGSSPTGVAGPYDSLNIGLSAAYPVVGSNPLLGTVYWETSTAGDYADGGAGGVGVFRQDQNWAPYSGAIEFTGDPISAPIPEPSSLLLLGTGLVGLTGVVFRRAKRRDRFQTRNAREPAS